MQYECSDLQCEVTACTSLEGKAPLGLKNSEQTMLFIKLLHRTIAQIIVASPKWNFNASFVVHSHSRAARWDKEFHIHKD